VAGDMTDNGRTAGVMTIADAARLLGVSERTIWRRVKAGKLATLDVHGKTCVQIDAPDTETPLAGAGVTLTGTVTELQAKLEAAYRDRIGSLEAENTRLWAELQAKQGIVDRLTLMLPAPAHAAPSGRLWPWIIGAAVVVAGGLVVLAYYAGWLPG